MADTLNRTFFMEELPKLAEAFAKEAGAATVHTDVFLRDGITLRMEGEPACTETYIAFDHKAGGHKYRIVLPYGSVVGVGFSETQEKTAIKGFKAE